MSDLDQEFNQLVDGMYQKISERYNNGEITRNEAETLRNMISERVTRPVTDWESSYDYDDNDSWNDSGCSY